MNTAASETAPDNPIDVVEQILSRRAYEPERRSQNEVVTEIQGRWNDMLLFFSWEENMRCLHLSCLMNIQSNVENRSKVFELIALANEELWLGHFSYWTEQNMPVFKHSILLNNDEESAIESKIAQIIEIAVKECERMYPVFNVVLTKGMDPRQALYPMLMNTVGNA